MLVCPCFDIVAKCATAFDLECRSVRDRDGRPAALGSSAGRHLISAALDCGASL